MHLAATTGPHPLALIFAIAVYIVLFLIGLSISAAILKLACRTAGAAVPDTGTAMVVSFLESIVGGVVYFASTLVVVIIGTAVHMDRSVVAAMVGVSALGMSVVAPAGLYVPMLRVTFSRGLVIAILRYVITFAILASLVLLIVLASGKIKSH
jgi:hypothetical protein